MSATVHPFPTTTGQPVKIDRPVYRTQQHRAADLAPGDVTRNRYGKWDEVVRVSPAEPHYVLVTCAVGGEEQLRSVALVPVQVVKPS